MILIGCPVQNREWILPNYLEHIENLDYDKKQISLYFIVNNSSDSSYKMLTRFKANHELEYHSIMIDKVNCKEYAQDDRSKAVRRNSTYYWLARLRNMLLDRAVELHASLLSCDCDILMRPDTIKRLEAHNVAAVSALIYNGYLKAPREPWLYPNILRWTGEKYEHVVNFYTLNPDKVPQGKLIPVDFTGACILIREDMCGKHRYAYFRRGEDAPFCRSIKPEGLFCDVSLINQHVMTKELK